MVYHHQTGILQEIQEDFWFLLPSAMLRLLGLPIQQHHSKFIHVDLNLYPKVEVRPYE